MKISNGEIFLAQTVPKRLVYILTRVLIQLDQLQSFTGLNKEDLKYLKPRASNDAVDRVKANKYAFGFVRLCDIAGSDLQSFVDGLDIVAIDQNENGRIDHYENYQQSYSELTRAVWIGKYPRSLFSELRLVSSTVPTDEASLNFIEWILTSGQAQLTAGGFSELVSGEIRSSLNHVYATESNISVEASNICKGRPGFYMDPGYYSNDNSIGNSYYACFKKKFT